MWWAFIRNSIGISVFLISACDGRRESSTKIYLASSLIPLEHEIKKLALNSIDMVFLSSSAIAKQIEQGAPCDIAILADKKWRDYLVHKGLVNADTLNIATNSLVLASLVRINAQGNVKEVLDALSPREKLIIADPDFVPLGAYTKEALEELGVYKKLSSQLVRAHSARSASLLLKQRAASLAIIYRSDALGEGIKIVGEIARRHHRPIQYPLVVCKGARRHIASGLRRMIISDDFRKILLAKGFY